MYLQTHRPGSSIQLVFRPGRLSCGRLTFGHCTHDDTFSRGTRPCTAYLREEYPTIAYVHPARLSCPRRFPLHTHRPCCRQKETAQQPVYQAVGKLSNNGRAHGVIDLSVCPKRISKLRNAGGRAISEMTNRSKEKKRLISAAQVDVKIRGC